MPKIKVLEDIVVNLDPTKIPHKYIICVKLKNDLGSVTVLSGESIGEFFDDPSAYPMSEARIVLDARKLHKAIIAEYQRVIAAATKLYQDRNLY